MTTEFPLEVLIRFWAKTTHDKERSPNAYHPLICHMIDVAAVAQVMWDKVLSKAAKKRVARAMGLPTDRDGLELTGRIIAWIAGLHDLGKASPPFILRGVHEKKKATYRLLTLYAGTVFSHQTFTRLILRAKQAPHGYVTAATFKSLLKEVGVPAEAAEQVADLIGAHHGTFATTAELRECGQESRAGNDEWQQARRDITNLMMELFGVKQAVGQLALAQTDTATIMLLAGLVSVADWIGSNSTYFPCIVRDIEIIAKADSAYWQSRPLERYRKRAGKRAARALRELGWLGWPEAGRERTFEELFPGKSPRPLQKAAKDLAKRLDQRPALIVIEDEMGRGKTETAIYLADVLSAKLGQRGIYFALPTMATSNQMFGRVSEYLRHRFPGVNVPIQLLHGHATLKQDFRELVEKSENALKFRGIYCDQADEQCDGSLLAAEWFTHRKKGLLVPFGVGTVDQALIAALRARHVFVRLFGLAHRTVIIDEVHAYDAYMSKLLERLLEWLGALKSPVILLSATLPAEKRQVLMNAYASGLQGREVNLPLPESEYPRITWTDGDRPETLPIKQFIQPEEEQKKRELVLEFVDGRLPDEVGEFTLGKRLKEQLKDHGCAVVICNTVDRAQQVYLALRDGGYFPESELDLFHARFTFAQREEREQLALRRFSRDRTQRPDKFVLVATQVVEQSLDLDFDLMVSDFAPLDLLLQRSGRLWRHEIGTGGYGPRFGFNQPMMWICAPEMQDGAPRFDHGTEAVYAPYSADIRKPAREFAPYVLLRSWLALTDKGKLLEEGKRYQLSIPDDIETLIGATYNTLACPEHLSDTLQHHWEEGKKEYGRGIDQQYGEAKDRRFREPWNTALFGDWFKFQVEEDSPEIHQSYQALTRLGDSIGIICLTGADNFNPKHKPTPAETEQLLQRSVTVSRRDLVPKLRAEPVPKGWKKSALLRHYRPVTLGKDIAGHVFHLDDKLGLLIEKSEKGNSDE